MSSSAEKHTLTVADLSAVRWLVLVIVLGGLTAFGPLAIDMYLPALPLIGEQLGGSASAVQLTLTACLAGLALGQLIAGPLSDRFGRKLPLLVGTAGFVLASLACAVAPTVPLLVVFRLVQGLTGAAGIVVARAVVRDLYEGVAAARFFSRLMIVTGLAPILAPVIGGQVLQYTSWRGVFALLAGIGLLLLVGVAYGVPETWPPARRSDDGTLRVVRSIFRLTRDRDLMGYALASGLGFAAMFAYISGSPFVVQNVYGASPQLFSLVFALNAFGLVVAGQVNGALVERFEPRRLLKVGLSLTLAGGIWLLAVVLLQLPGLGAFLPPLFVLVTSLGFVFPNATALALAEHPEAAGSASALLGVLQFIIGAAVAPLVGVAGDATAVPMAVVIALMGVGAMAAFLTLAHSQKKIRRGPGGSGRPAEPGGPGGPGGPLGS
ncbi:MAG: multidrug effflux MFS transporter [Thermoleophilia bacterium]